MRHVLKGNRFGCPTWPGIEERLPGGQALDGRAMRYCGERLVGGEAEILGDAPVEPTCRGRGAKAHGSRRSSEPAAKTGPKSGAGSQS